MKNEPLQLNGHCYVLLRGNWTHPIAFRRHELLWYPETSMNLIDRYVYRPYVQSIVTECAWLIALYDYTKVRVVEENGTWQYPTMQTYAAAHDYIITHLLHIPSSVAGMPLDGGCQFKKVVRAYKRRIDKALKIYQKELDKALRTHKVMP